MKQGFNIRVYAENNQTKLSSVKGKLLDGTIDMKIFIVKDTYEYVAYEFYTGMRLTSGKTEKECIEDVLRRERNIEYWEDGNARIEYNRKMIQDNLNLYGYANK